MAKPVTAALALRLADRDRLDLDAAVSTYLPTSLALTDRFDAGRRPGDVVAALGGAEAGPPGDFQYSSTNYLLLAAVVEAATGRPVAEVLEGEVLEPLPGTASAGG